jgi:hypothetical protein
MVRSLLLPKRVIKLRALQLSAPIHTLGSVVDFFFLYISALFRISAQAGMKNNSNSNSMVA